MSLPDKYVDGCRRSSSGLDVGRGLHNFSYFNLLERKGIHMYSHEDRRQQVESSHDVYLPIVHNIKQLIGVSI